MKTAVPDHGDDRLIRTGNIGADRLGETPAKSAGAERVMERPGPIGLRAPPRPIPQIASIEKHHGLMRQDRTKSVEELHLHGMRLTSRFNVVLVSLFTSKNPLIVVGTPTTESGEY
jgi:hypothetical protein